MNPFEKFSTFPPDEREKAQDYASELVNACINGEYRKLSSEELSRFILSASEAGDGSGYFSVLTAAFLPKKLRVRFVYEPTYAVLAAGMYLISRGNMTGEVYQIVRNLQELVQRDGIQGFGEEAQEVRKRVSAMFEKAVL